MSRTVAFRETTTLPWLTSPMTWPWRWTASKAAARLRADAHQEGPRGVRERGLAGGGAVERVDLAVAVHPRHQEAHGAPACAGRAERPAARRRTSELFRAAAGPSPRACGSSGRPAGGVDLGHRPGPHRHRVDAPSPPWPRQRPSAGLAPLERRGRCARLRLRPGRRGRDEPRREDERLVVVGPLVDGCGAEEGAQLLAEALGLALALSAQAARTSARRTGRAASRVLEAERERLEPVGEQGHLVDALGRTPTGRRSAALVVGHEPRAVGVLAVLRPEGRDVRRRLRRGRRWPRRRSGRRRPRASPTRATRSVQEKSRLSRSWARAAAAIRARACVQPGEEGLAAEGREVRRRPLKPSARPARGPPRTRAAPPRARAPRCPRRRPPRPRGASRPSRRRRTRAAQASAQGSPAEACEVPATDAASVRQPRAARSTPTRPVPRSGS